MLEYLSPRAVSEKGYRWFATYEEITTERKRKGHFELLNFRVFVLSFFRSFVLSFFRSFVLSFFRSFVLSFFRSFAILVFFASINSR